MKTSICLPETAQAVAAAGNSPKQGIYVTVELKTAEQGISTDESFALHRIVQPSCVQSVLVNQLLASQSEAYPVPHPALKVHSEVRKPAKRRKSEVLERLRKRQLSQSSFNQTKSTQHARGSSVLATPNRRPVASPLKSSWLIHSSKATSQTFDFPAQELKVQGRPPKLQGHLASLLLPRILRKTATTVSSSS
jgi:hypothetical protein